MNSLLAILLRIAGALLLMLAALHVPICRRLKWREETVLMSPVNAAIFHVHALFIGLILVLMGLPCLMDPMVFLEKSRGGEWLAWIFAAFWTTRLHAQWFVFPQGLWRGKKTETRIHFVFTILWLFLAALFIICGARQTGWLQ
jgi:hypothetical protein